jgi:hypothetical protein
MFEPARRWRLLAALALLLALAHRRAWGQQSFCTKTAGDVLRCVRKLSNGLPPVPPDDEIDDCPCGIWDGRCKGYQPTQPQPIFAWEKKDGAEWGFAVASFLEAMRDYKCAYLCHRTLALGHPARQSFAAAAARARAKYLVAQSYPAGTPGYGLISRIDDQFTWLNPAEPKAPPAITSTPLPGYDAEHSDGPLTDEFLDAAEADGRAADSQIYAREPFGPGLFRGLVLKHRSFSMFPRPATPNATAPVLPEEKDMLPDSEHTPMLIELGVINDLRKVIDDLRKELAIRASAKASLRAMFPNTD